MFRLKAKLGLGVLALGVMAAGWSSQARASITVEAGGHALGQTQWVDAGYGSLGYLFYDGTHGARNEQPGILKQELPAWVSQSTVSAGSSGTAGSSSNAVALQDPSGAGTFHPGIYIPQTGISDDDQHTMVTLTLTSGVPDSVRIGILVGAALQGQHSIPDVVGIAGGSAQAVQTTDKTAGASTPRADWYFFDISGLTAGDTITLTASRNSEASKVTSLEGFTLSPVPEPGSLSLLGLAGLGMLSRRKRSSGA